MVGVAQRFIDGAVGILLSLQNIQADTPSKAEGSCAVLPQVIRQLKRLPFRVKRCRVELEVRISVELA